MESAEGWEVCSRRPFHKTHRLTLCAAPSLGSVAGRVGGKSAVESAAIDMAAQMLALQHIAVVADSNAVVRERIGPAGLVSAAALLAWSAVVVVVLC